MSLYDNHLNVLFARCNDLRQGFNHIERQAETVQEISMNASVAAGQTGNHSRAFSEVAHQIARTAKKMRSQVNLMRKEVNEIVNTTLRLLIYESRLAKYEAAFPHIKGQENRHLLSAQIFTSNSQILDGIQGIYSHVFPVESAIKTLTGHQYRLFGALSALKIESTDLYGSQFFAISALSDQLSENIECGLGRLVQVRRLLRLVYSEAHAVESVAKKGVGYAERNAA